LSVPLDFLDPGEAYTAEIYRDGDNADWKTDPYDLVIEERELARGDVLELPLAAGGGAAIRFRMQR
jgi:alpha-glucosidase